MGLLTDKVVVVTGAGGGLGESHALMCAAEGASIVVNDLGGSVDGSGQGNSPADKVVARIVEGGGKAVANYVDVTMNGAGAHILATALNAFGRVDVLINNAGILRDKSFPKMSLDDWDLVMKVHTRSLYTVTHPFFCHWKVEKQGAVVINTTSPSGLIGNFGQTNYGAAKRQQLGLHAL